MEAGKTDAEIAAEVGTTATAVHLAVKRSGLPPRRTLALTARGVADRLGVSCAKTVVRWIEQGWLRGCRAYRMGPHRIWHVSETDLFSFVADPDHWHRWDPARIPDPALREWATEIRAGVRFLTVGEASYRMCVQPATVHQWIAKGWLPAVRDRKSVV